MCDAAREELSELACESPQGFDYLLPRGAGVYDSCGVEVSIHESFGAQITLALAKFIMEGIEKGALCRGYREEALIAVSVRGPGHPYDVLVAIVVMKALPNGGNPNTETSTT